jgi:DNA-binding NtrC family response regulator
MVDILPILVVDDDRRMRELLAEVFSENNYQVTIASDGDEAIQALDQNNFGLIITDLQMPKQDGIAILQYAMNADADVPVIMITGHGSIDSALAAMKQGAYDYLEKPFDPEELLLIARRAVDHYQLICQARQLNETIEELRGQELVGSGTSMQKVKELIAKVASLDVAVLVQGETGTGKELVARLIHQHSRRVEQRFLPINCGAVAEGLLESELFGHEAGSFTSANTLKKGLFELADKGTLFLDEINNMPLQFQIKILRFLQDQSFMRVGGIQELHADVRVVAATNTNLAEEIKAKRFRDDLYYRLKVMTIKLPPLRERLEDIPELAYYFLQKYNLLYEKKVVKIDRVTLAMFEDYPWPGNVRELENIISSAVIMATGATLTKASLPDEFKEFSVFVSDDESYNLSEMEQRLINKALKKTHGNKTRSARLLGIDTSTLWRKLKRYDLE